LPLLLQIGLGVILFDLVYYCYHRASHRVGWLWALHRLHHSPERLTVTKGFRHTFPEWGLDVVLHTTVFTLVAMPPRVMFWVYAITIPIGILSHANLGGKILTWPANALNLPATHRIHHDRASRGGFSNFSAFTMLWDHVFGTFVSPGRYEPERLGTADYVAPKGFFRQVLSFLPRDQTETRSRDAASSSSLNPNRRGSLSRST
jgi:sterol desaturase/sphingolipid hydroxylase (fatty acid hydroxylase superfamily)